jgi:GxxExxY protein
MLFFVIVTSDLEVAGLIEHNCCMVTAPIRRISGNEISHAIITAAMGVHTELGPGLLESTYTACLQHQLHEAGVSSAAQVGLPVVYHGVKLELGYRIDLLVEGLVIVEIKSVEAVSPVHQAQLLSYLKLSGKSIGLLINFNVVHLKDGIRRFVNGTDWK